MAAPAQFRLSSPACFRARNGKTAPGCSGSREQLLTRLRLGRVDVCRVGGEAGKLGGDAEQ